MDEPGFDKIWNLLRQLFPASAKVKSAAAQTVWRRALEPYDLDAVTDACIDCARRSKFFPDIADVTGGLPAPAHKEESETEDWVQDSVELLRYAQAAFGGCSEAHADVYHAHGVQTWPEAQAAGVGWAAWLGGCRTAFSAGGHTSIIPAEV
jgi:hypothetical protein